MAPPCVARRGLNATIAGLATISQNPTRHVWQARRQGLYNQHRFHRLPSSPGSREPLARHQLKPATGRGAQSQRLDLPYTPTASPRPVSSELPTRMVW